MNRPAAAATAASGGQTTPSSPSGTGRSEQIRTNLVRALAGGRAVAISGHTGDVLLANDGRMVRLREWLALLAADNKVDLIVVTRAGVSLDVPPEQDPVGPPPPTSDGGDLRDVLTQLLPALAERNQPAWVLLVALDREIHQDPDLLQDILELPLDPRLTRHRVLATFRVGEPHPDLLQQPGWVQIDIPLPDAAERRFALALTDARQPFPLAEGLHRDVVADQLGGVELDALLRLARERRALGPLNTSRIIELKSEEIRRNSAGALDLLHTPGDQVPELAGMANLKLLVATRTASALTPPPIVLAGPPGGGKTLSFRWLAQAFGLPGVQLGLVRSPYVGESERTTRRALDVLASCAPLALLIDEADMGDTSRRGGGDLDGGVSARMRQANLDLLNRCTDLGVVAVLTTNRLDNLDEAVKDRAVILPVLHPTHREAVEIGAIAARRRGATLDEATLADVLDPHAVVPRTGRHVVQIVDEAHLAAALAGHPHRIDAEQLRQAAADALDGSDSSAQELMALQALLAVKSATAYPWIAAVRLGLPVEVPPYVTPYLLADGTLDIASVRERVRHLNNAGHGW